MERIKKSLKEKTKFKKIASFVTLLALLLSSFASFAVSVPEASACTKFCPFGDVKYEIGGGYEYTDDSATISSDGRTVYWSAAQGCTVTDVCIKMGGTRCGSLAHPDPSLGQWTTGEHDISYVVLTTDCQPAPVCGDGVLDAGEECDEGENNGTECSPEYGSSCTYCSNECTIVELQGPYCGDGECNGDEACETCSEDCGQCPECTCDEDCDDGIDCTVDTCVDGACQYDDSNCPFCGDGQCNYGETCETCSEDCGICPVPESLTIKAYKIVCEAEEDLPNWGNGGSDITETTAQDFVNGNQSCYLEEGWSFEWAYAGTVNPGDNIIGPAGGAWTTFGPTESNGLAVTNISSLSGDRVWVREVMQGGYISFSGDTTEPRDDVSAEMYCHKDVLNYDNYDYIINPVLGETYYCVAFNAPIMPEETDVTLCKEDNEGEKLDGWELSLVSDSFNASGTTEGQCQNTGCVTFEDVPYGTYEIEEVLKEGWENVSGLGEVEVNSENPTFTIVNKETEEVDTATIKAYKVICEDESYLPDWARTSNSPTQITEGLINQYVADSEGKCWFEPDWEFEWGYDGTAQKQDGDYYGAAGIVKGWNPFDLMTSESTPAILEIEEDDLESIIWVREVLQEGYIPFTHPEEGWDSNEEMVSAEILCHIDGYKYDNYDRVDNPQANSTYYCVAFNAPIMPEETDVTLCKEDNEGTKLGGWELSLVSDSFNASGTTEGQCQNTGCVTFEDVPYGTYEIEEVLKEGWENVSGLGEVEVNTENPTFTIVNKETGGPPVTFYALTATTTGFGWVTSSPEGINCGYEAFECEEDYEEGTDVTLTATPGGGQKFDGWGGDCSGTTTVCALTMDEPKSVTATFVLIPGVITYTVTFDGNGGTPTSTDVVVIEGETVDPLPTAIRTGYDFVEWNTASDGSGDEFTTATAVIADITVYAIWQEIEEPVEGCTDPEATNYNPEATVDDGSCTYPPGPVYGCTDPSATNYNASATADDGSCSYGSRSGGYAPGQVLGEKIEECGIYLYEYIEYGASNNPYEVRKLQTFLNLHMGSNLSITGIYNWATMQVLNQFQVQYKEQVLQPWVGAGTHCDVNEPTGYVYKTTQRWINLIMCPTLNIPMPNLSGYPQADCTAYWQAILGTDIIAAEDGVSDGAAEENGAAEAEGLEELIPEDEEIIQIETEGEAETKEREIPMFWLIVIIILAAVALIWFVYKGMKR